MERSDSPKQSAQSDIALDLELGQYMTLLPNCPTCYALSVKYRRMIVCARCMPAFHCATCEIPIQANMFTMPIGGGRFVHTNCLPLVDRDRP